MTPLAIHDRLATPGAPVFIIAEAGVNHNGSLERALQLVDIAADAGADAVKFQTFDVDRLVTRDAPKATYQIETTGDGESQHAMLARLQLGPDDHRALVRRCEERGILFLSTPFDEIAADFLAGLGVSAFKTPSGELTNLPYLAHVARHGKPMIVSTGMATLEDVAAAVEAIASAGKPPLVLLHCVSAYPAAPGESNLRAMETMSRAFGVPVGYSDHSTGIEIAIAAAALGACAIEKHFTVDRSLPGPDHRASLEPGELHAMVRGIRTVEVALGDGRKVPAASEAATANVARKSVVAARDIAAGSEIGREDLIAKRPGTGLPPAARDLIVGRRALQPIPAGTLLAWHMVA